MLRLILVFLAAVPVFTVPQYDEYDATDTDWETDGRIIGGVPATIGEFPFIVALMHKSRGFLGGGAIITKDWVLTAAHCIPTKATHSGWTLRAGSIYRNKGGVTRGVADTKKQEYPRRDIGLIKVDEPWPLNGDTISLGRLSRQVDLIPERTPATIIGWGRTKIPGPNSETLMKQDVFVVSNDYCRAVERFWFGTTRFTDNYLCTLFDPEKMPSTASKGDSGSPVMVNDEVVAVHFGKFGSVYAPDHHTRVSLSIDWIEEHVGPLPSAK